MEYLMIALLGISLFIAHITNMEQDSRIETLEAAHSTVQQEKE